MTSNKIDKNKLLILILLIITVVAVGVTAWTVWFREPANPPLAPDYAPQQTEQNAEAMADGDNDKLQSPSGGGAVSLMYTKEVSIDLSDKKATLLFGNPSKSNQNMVVQLVIQDEILIRSGLITPGNKVQTLELLNGAEKKLQPGGYDGKLVVLYYNQETGEKAVLNTEISVTVTVAE